MQIETTVGNGFPVIANVTYFTPPERKIITCTTIDPPDPGELEFELLLRNEKPAPGFVYDLMSDADEERIIDELYDELDPSH